MDIFADTGMGLFTVVMLNWWEIGKMVPNLNRTFNFAPKKSGNGALLSSLKTLRAESKPKKSQERRSSVIMHCLIKLLSEF